jgi:hypothetical protein
MKYNMISIRNHKTATVLVAIAALAGVLVLSTSAIGSGHIALAANDNVIKVFNNKAHNVQTNTNEKQVCKTTGSNSPISGLCHAATVTAATGGGITTTTTG